MNEYVMVNNKKLRMGYTTGSCGAAASKAAVRMLFLKGSEDTVSIDTPAGIRLTLPVTDAVVTSLYARCSVVKDGGDDPDCTTGLKVFAEARHKKDPGVIIRTGEGIGIVTLPGLKVPVGESAINPVPMQMILKEVEEVLPEGRGVEIVLSVPGGAEVAQKTYNPRLGIIGGISILGTTGIVRPMSEEAWKDALALELNVVAARGFKQVVFIFGNYGESFVSEGLGMDPGCVVKISNFVGFMLVKAVEVGFKEVLLVGHPGKLVKVAAGIFHTHSRVADARMEILAAYAGLEGADTKAIQEIYGCRTTEAAIQIIQRTGLLGIYERIVENASKRCEEYGFHQQSVGCILFHGDNRLLAMDKKAKEILKEMERGKDVR